MANSVIYWLRATYRANPPEMAQDASPARDLSATMSWLRRLWTRRFTTLSQRLAAYFTQQVSQRSDLALKSSLKRGGMSVEFKMTAAMNDVLQATVAENVALIKSIPTQYLTQVEGAVMRSVQAGRDLASLSEALQHQHGVTKRRAALISRDQNNKATAVLTRARYIELGIDRARWLHSAGGKEPRPSHVKASRDRVTFLVSEGWFDPHEQRHIQPGELINCKCVAVPVLGDEA